MNRSFGGRLYEAKGREVWVQPIIVKEDDGTTTMTLGFKFCEVAEAVKDPEAIAAALAELMNQGPQA